MLVFDGDLPVDYRQFYVRSDHEADLCGPVFEGQVNGLCGAAVPGLLFCTTGTHYGRVGLRVEVLPEEPAQQPEYEEAVEASFRPSSARTWVQEWNGPTVCHVPLHQRWYRVRYSAHQFQAGVAAETDVERDFAVVIDRYLMQFWPETGPRPDEVVLQTSTLAAHWHDVAGRGPRRHRSAPPAVRRG